MTNKSNENALRKAILEEGLEKGIIDNDDLPIEFFSEDEAKVILEAMNHQEEMFLGGLNDPLMSTPLGYYKELRDEFGNVGKAWKELKKKITQYAHKN